MNANESSTSRSTNSKDGAYLDPENVKRARRVRKALDSGPEALKQLAEEFKKQETAVPRHQDKS